MHIYLKFGLSVSLQILRMHPLALPRPEGLILWLLNGLTPLESNATVRNLLKMKQEDFLNEIGLNIQLRNSRNIVLEAITLAQCP